MGGHKGGRKRIPTALHLLQGGRKKTHRPLPPNEPHPPAIIPKCPKHLDAEARKEWRRYSKLLGPLGILTNIDGPVFDVLCSNLSAREDVEKKFRLSGILVKNKSGLPYVNPLFYVLKNLEGQILKCLVELGMTPSSRSKVKVTPKPQKDAAEDFLNEGMGGK